MTNNDSRFDKYDDSFDLKPIANEDGTFASLTMSYDDTKALVDKAYATEVDYGDDDTDLITGTLEILFGNDDQSLKPIKRLLDVNEYLNGKWMHVHEYAQEKLGNRYCGTHWEVLMLKDDIDNRPHSRIEFVETVKEDIEIEPTVYLTGNTPVTATEMMMSQLPEDICTVTMARVLLDFATMLGSEGYKHEDGVNIHKDLEKHFLLTVQEIHKYTHIAISVRSFMDTHGGGHYSTLSE